MMRSTPVLLLLALAAPLAAQGPRDLSGRWVLPDSTAGACTRAPRFTARTSPSGHPVPTDRGAHRRNRRQLGLLLGMAGAVPAFTLEQTRDSMTVTNADGFRYVLRPGADEQRLTIQDSLEIRYRARWEGTFLDVEWRPEGGGTFTERYQLADSGLFLRIDVSVRHESFRCAESRMYRRAGPEP